ncbi:hypothetical protein D3C85_1873290 [compost metagenome]
MLELVGNVRHQHLGVADTRRLRQVQLMHQVVAHGIQQRHLKKLGGPFAFAIRRLGRHVEIFIGPLHGGHGRIDFKVL